MKRKFLALFILSLVFSLIQFPALASVKPGSVCPKTGQIRIYAGMKYTCIKSGKKLIWNKGVPLPKPIPTSTSIPTPTSTSTPSPTPTPSPSATLEPTPTPSPSPTPSRPKLSFFETLNSGLIDGKFPIEYETFPVPTKLPTSWEDLYENREGIAYKAWQSISNSVLTSQSSLGKVKLLTGPNTVLLNPDLETPMNLVSKAFSGASQPGLVTVIAFSYQDQMWADTEYRKLIANEPDYLKRSHQNYVSENMCNTTRKVCWSAMGFTNSTGDGIILLGVTERETLRKFDPSYSNFARSEKGLTIAHEYFHTIQRNIIGRNWFQGEYTPPIWFNEAAAVMAENGAMNSNSFDEYMRFRAVDSRFANQACGNPVDGCIPITEAIMTDFLSLTHYQSNWGNFPYGMKYEVSHRVIESLVAIKGHKSITDLYGYMAQNHTFEQAFLQIYGIQYGAAIPILAKIVNDEFMNNR